MEAKDLQRIGFDGKRAVLNYSGLGNYSRLAIELLAERLPKAEMLIYTPKVKPNPQLEPLLENEKVKVVTPDTRIGRTFGSLWRGRGMAGQAAREGVELFHGVSNKLPAGIEKTGIPSVVTIHDVIFMRHPEFYHRADVAIYTRSFRHSAERADRVIAISECTKRDLMELYGIDEDKIDLVYQGCDESFYRPVTPEKIADVRRRYELPERYIVGVGTIEARKNQLLAVRALPLLPEDISLVFVGRRTKYADEIQAEAERLGVGPRVRLIHGALFADFPAFYAGALVSSYPSWYEGFGIPVMESIAAGTPVIAATGSCLEEAGGPGAMYVNGNDTRGFADAAAEIISSPALRERMVAEGREYIRRFSRQNFADGLIATYNKVLR